MHTLAGWGSSYCCESAAPGQIISLSIGKGTSDQHLGPALEIMTCNIHRNLFLYFCLLPNRPTDIHYRNIYIPVEGSHFQGGVWQHFPKTVWDELQWGISSAHPLLFMFLSVLSLLAPPAPTLRETCHCSSTQSQLFHLILPYHLPLSAAQSLPRS